VSTSTSEQSPPPIQPYETPPGGRRWRTGTLVYTSTGLAVLFFWLLWGDFTISLKDRSVTPTFQVLLRTYHAKAIVFSLLLNVLPTLISLALIPAISYRSDRHRGRWGRRIPYLLIPTPLAAATMILLGFSPHAGRGLHALLGGARAPMTTDGCIIFCMGVFWTLFEFANITCGAVFAWLINDVVPPSLMGRFYGMFRVLSLLAGMIFSWCIYGTVATNYLIVFVSIGLLYGVSFTAMCMRVKEGEHPPPPPVPPGSGKAFSNLGRAVQTYARDSFSNPYYLWFFFSLTLANIAFLPINNYSVPFSTSLGMSDKIYGHFSAIQLGCSMIQAFPIGWLADKIHPIRMTMIALLLYSLSTFVAFVFVRSAWTFAAAHVICGTISGFWLTATAALGPRLLPKSKFATYASAAGIVAAPCTMFAGLVVGWSMDLLNPGRTIDHYDFHSMYLWASVGAALSLMLTWIVYRKFMAYGGPEGYLAPE